MMRKATKVENKNENEDTVEVNEEQRALEANDIIKNHMIASIGFGVIPAPIVDLVGLAATQLNMLRKLSSLYGHEFSDELAKKSIASLIGGGLTLPVAMGLYSLIKFVPVIGQTAGVISLGTTGAASTYAIGKVFIKHFESGGDFLSFNSKNAKDDFEEELDNGKETASNIKKETASTAKEGKASA